jgi:hypothetical protein
MMRICPATLHLLIYCGASLFETLHLLICCGASLFETFHLLIYCGASLFETLQGKSATFWPQFVISGLFFNTSQHL